MARRSFCLLLGLGVCQFAFGQWPFFTVPGQAGEPCLATDNKGNVYLTTHQDARLMLSQNWGGGFSLVKSFNDSCCDFMVTTKGLGKLLVTYLSDVGDGIRTWSSTDHGQTMVQGTAPSGPLDREWAVFDTVSNRAYMVYSNGHIGGEPSTGVFLARSENEGLNFAEIGRMDNEILPNRAVDPYIAVGTTGRLYSMWTSTEDNNTIDKFAFAFSANGGDSFTGHKTIATVRRDLGTTQERWMYGCLVAKGPSTIYAFYVDYKEVLVDSVIHKPLLVHYRVSNDGGLTFAPPTTVSSALEIEASIRSFEANKIDNLNYPYYLQTLPWVTTDPTGNLHIAYADNRAGQQNLMGQPYGKWQIRYALGNSTFGLSQRVSDDFVMKRPTLDFLSIAADSLFVYIAWVEVPNSTLEFNFTGTTKVARKPNFVPSLNFAIPF